MKKKYKILALFIVFIGLGMTIQTYAGRCQDLCIPEENGSCALTYGDDGDPTVCGGYKNWEMME